MVAVVLREETPERRKLRNEGGDGMSGFPIVSVGALGAVAHVACESLDVKPFGICKAVHALFQTISQPFGGGPRELSAPTQRAPWHLGTGRSGSKTSVLLLFFTACLISNTFGVRVGPVGPCERFGNPNIPSPPDSLEIT